METNTVLINLPSFSGLSNGDRPTQTVGSPSEFENLIVIPSVCALNEESDMTFDLQNSEILTEDNVEIEVLFYQKLGGEKNQDEFVDEENNFELETDENNDIGNVENVAPNQDLTKKGQIRKRKPKEMTPQQRKSLKMEKAKKKLKLQPPCQENCRKKCTTKIHENQRQNLNKQIWAMNSEQRKMFILSCTLKKPVQRRR